MRPAVPVSEKITGQICVNSHLLTFAAVAIAKASTVTLSQARTYSQMLIALICL